MRDRPDARLIYAGIVAALLIVVIVIWLLMLVLGARP